MKYRFYQNLQPIGKLIEVGEYDVPDGIHTWHVPVRPKVEMKSMADLLKTLERPLVKTIIYHKSDLGFIAYVDTTKQP